MFIHLILIFQLTDMARVIRKGCVYQHRAESIFYGINTIMLTEVLKWEKKHRYSELKIVLTMEVKSSVRASQPSTYRNN